MDTEKKRKGNEFRRRNVNLERIKWTDWVTNEEILQRVGGERILKRIIKERKKNLVDHFIRSRTTEIRN